MGCGRQNCESTSSRSTLKTSGLQVCHPKSTRLRLRRTAWMTRAQPETRELERDSFQWWFDDEVVPHGFSHCGQRSYCSSEPLVLLGALVCGPSHIVRLPPRLEFLLV
ncbi:hypothetical protein H310_01096 [Aphanomyces invadans]|uniref:Uncharacterized protein n=1 Tax=Aphanomyces invadans TaxID=157072 RepID=A0A024UQG6_9STRA|nr:hypothetical protein H310_01096 [Aphanomyces invadans]ETW08534.1 hypothetical protein H310_01096 [Aphanomyces invadans]|eukprot:XP_008862339.1 hypothetical protein H310_01096 [Aphanomyces invadans]